MKIRVFKFISDNRFVVEVKTEDFSQNELLLMSQFGEPKVNTGGAYGNDPPDTDGWTLPDSFSRIRSDFKPFQRSFDVRDYPVDAEARSIAWGEKIVERITEAITELRENDNSFTSEEVTNV